MTTSPQPEFTCDITYDAAIPCLVMTWKGHATSSQFREANERVLEAIKARAAAKLLGDTRDFVLIGSEDQQWLSADWIPRAVDAGLRTVALLMPKFYFNRMAMDAVGEKLPQTLMFERFEDRHAAREWLRLM